MEMSQNLRTPLSIVLAGCLASASVHAQSTRFVPGDEFVAHTLPCGNSHWNDPCIVPLVNGDFEGLPGDSYLHFGSNWAGGGQQHSIVEHIRPWSLALVDGDVTPYMDKATKRFRLERAGDGIWQSVTLPALKGPMGATVHERVTYSVRARFGGVASGARLKMTLTADLGGDFVGQSRVFESSSSVGAPLGGRIEATLPFEPEWADAKLGVSLRYEEGSAPVEIDDIVIVRHDGEPFAPVE